MRGAPDLFPQARVRLAYGGDLGAGVIHEHSRQEIQSARSAQNADFDLAHTRLLPELFGGLIMCFYQYGSCGI